MSDWWQAQHLIERQRMEELFRKMEGEVEQGRKLLENLTETEKVTYEHQRPNI